MANPHRGQVPLAAGGVTYTLSMSINAMCVLEAHLKKPIGEILLEMYAVQANPARLSLTLSRAVLWASLQDHHGDIDLVSAGDLVGEVGLPKAFAAVTEAVKMAFPEQGAGKAKADARPPKAAG